ncbi:MAG: DUF4124 domain-containing protein [Gammaproteobacteria bacterium]|nr:DUF4124 domain-containing protein [Gammaproteobacteria bacterium]
MPRTLPLALAALLLLTAGGVLAAPIYKWTDADGQVHYEDLPPPQAEVEVIRAAEPYRGETPASPTATREGASAATATDAREADTRRQQLCEQNRAALDEAQTAQRMYRLDEDGRRVYLSEAEIATHLAELRAAIASTCTAAAE